MTEVLKGRHVLVVDDERRVRFLVHRLLEQAGCEVIEADNGEAALANIGDLDVIDLLVTDVKMAQLDGWGLARIARAMHPEIAVLYVTAHGDDPGLVPGSNILFKPFTAQALLEAAASAIELNQVRRTTGFH